MIINRSIDSTPEGRRKNAIIIKILAHDWITLKLVRSLSVHFYYQGDASINNQNIVLEHRSRSVLSDWSCHVTTDQCKSLLSSIMHPFICSPSGSKRGFVCDVLNAKFLIFYLKSLVIRCWVRALYRHVHSMTRRSYRSISVHNRSGNKTTEHVSQIV